MNIQDSQPPAKPTAPKSVKSSKEEFARDLQKLCDERDGAIMRSQSLDALVKAQQFRIHNLELEITKLRASLEATDHLNTKMLNLAFRHEARHVAKK